MLFNKAFLLCASVLLCQVVHAQTIDLDPIDPVHCRQQLLSAKDNFPVIVAYFHNCPWAKQFLPIYEAVAKKHPERTFFKFDFQDEKRYEVAMFCLQAANFLASPTVMVVGRKQDSDTGKNYITAPLRIRADGRLSVEDVESLITLPNIKK